MLSTISVLILTLLCILFVFTLYVRYCYYGRQLSKIPGPPRWPLLGNAIEAMALDPVAGFMFLRELRKKYGRINKLTAFFVAIINISDPEYIEKLLSTSTFNEKRLPYNFLRNWLRGGLLVSNGAKWKKRRKLLTPSFHFSILKSFSYSVAHYTTKLVDLIEHEVDNESTEILPLVTTTTLGVMCETSMGSVIDTSTTVYKNYSKALESFGKIIETRIATVWFHFDWIYNLFPLYKLETKLVKDMHAFTSNLINKRIKIAENNNKARNCLPENHKHRDKPRLAMLDLLLELEKEGQIDMDGVKEEVDTFVFEGHDTTASVLSFMIMRTANESEIQEKIYQEQCRIFGTSNRTCSFEDLSEMKYLECCIKESLRLYPSVPVVARYVSEDIVLGQKFAMLELKTVMSGLLRRFRLEPVTRPEDVIFVGDIILRCRDPLLVRFRLRSELCKAAS